MPAPFGLIRYGVAPDHPRIKDIITALHKVLDKPQHPPARQRRLRHRLHARRPAPLLRRGDLLHRRQRRPRADIPGIDLDGSYGAADFVSWYDGHPDVPRDLAARGREGRRPRRRQRRARRRARARQDRRRTAAHRDPAERLRGPQGQQGRRGARLRAPRPGPGQVHARSSCASWTTPRPSRSSSTPRTSTTTRARAARAAASKQVDMVANTLQDWAIRDAGQPPAQAVPALLRVAARDPRRGRQGRRPAHRAHRTRRHRQRHAAPASTTTGTSRPSTAPSATCSQNSPSCRSTTQAGTVPNEAGRVVDEAGEPAVRRASTSPAGSSAARSA